MHRPPATLGMRHVALNVNDVGACERFYVGLLGMTVEWRPDADNVYLTSGNDNLALHRAPGVAGGQSQRLDHIGFFQPRAGRCVVRLSRRQRRCGEITAENAPGRRAQLLLQ
jgi:catechol 2,3-dioxygenase-like lactoylglutathione lyase family enzyme